MNNNQKIEFQGQNSPDLSQQHEATLTASQVGFDPKLKTALFIVRDKGGCGFYRCYQPASFLRLRHLMNTIVDFKETTREHIMQADIVIFQETGSPKSVEMMHFARQNHKPIVVEFDDEVRSISPHNTGGFGAWNYGSLYIHRFIEQVKIADAITVSTPQLAREYFPFNPNIYVIPNFLSMNKWDNPLEKKEDGYFRIGWAGGNAHLDDLNLVSKVIKKIVKESSGKVKFETMGMVKKELKGILSALEEFDDICPKCGYQGESKTSMGESLENYPLVLATYGWDMAIAPIVNTAFNSAKSDLKLKEYAATGFPMVASAVTPYIEAKENGCDVVLAKNFDEWYNGIKELMENPDRRRQMVKNNKEWVSKHWIDDNIVIYHDVYSRIIEKYNSSKH